MGGGEEESRKTEGKERRRKIGRKEVEEKKGKGKKDVGRKPRERTKGVVKGKAKGKLKGDGQRNKRLGKNQKPVDGSKGGFYFPFLIF